MNRFADETVLYKAINDHAKSMFDESERVSVWMEDS